MERKKVLIIGGVACGAKTAARLARIAPGCDITILERGEHLSFAGCGFPYFVGDVVKEYKDLVCTPLGIIRDVNFFRTVKNIHVRTNCLATRIDREKSALLLLIQILPPVQRRFSRTTNWSWPPEHPPSVLPFPALT